MTPIDALINGIVFFQQTLKQAAKESLVKTIGMPDADRRGFGPNGDAIGADFIGVKLLAAEQPALAGQIYRSLADETVAWREKHGQHRHAGRFLANLGACLALTGDIDRACIAFWRAAQEDELTSNTLPENSFAIREMFDHYFGRQAREFAWTAANRVNFRVDLEQVEHLSRSLGTNEYAFVLYLHVGKTYEEEAADFESDFSYLQKLNVIRSLSVVLESELRNIWGIPSGTLREVLVEHHRSGRLSWFPHFDRRRVEVGATRSSVTPVDDQLREALATTVISDDERFWRNVLVAYIVRNYSAHQTDISPNFLRTDFVTVVGHVVNAMVHAPNYR